MRAQRRAYSAAHRDESAARARAYNVTHRDLRAARARAYYITHRDELQAKARQSDFGKALDRLRELARCAGITVGSRGRIYAALRMS